MKIIDFSNPEHFEKYPNKKIILISKGNNIQNGFKIKNLELRLYANIKQDESVLHSIITAYLETDEHSIEALYEEGNLNDNSLQSSAELLTNSLGLSGLILRLIITLENRLKLQNGH
tara:strand:- start:1291 stop:1641 length:351 start_codon:yes stop_codon:yes gene_type:complete